MTLAPTFPAGWTVVQPAASEESVPESPGQAKGDTAHGPADPEAGIVQLNIGWEQEGVPGHPQLHVHVAPPAFPVAWAVVTHCVGE